jgi:hypothetical protein
MSVKCKVIQYGVMLQYRAGRRIEKMKTKKKGTTKKKAAVAKKKGEGKGAGRPSIFSGKVLTKAVSENPRRAGTAGHKSFSVIKNGMTFEQYVAAGGRRQDLAWDVEKGNVKVKAA